MSRIPTFARLLALALLFSWPVASNTADGTSSDARSLALRFVDGWNAHDAAALGVLMAADADWVTASGERLHGRDRIQAYLAGEHATWAKTTTMRARNIHVRALNGKTAVVSFEWEIATPAENDAAPTIARGNNVFVAMNEGGWIVVSGQVARVRAQ